MIYSIGKKSKIFRKICRKFGVDCWGVMHFIEDESCHIEKEVLTQKEFDRLFSDIHKKHNRK